MVNHSKIRSRLSVLGLILYTFSFAAVHAEDFYVAQNAIGSGNGADAANAYAIGFFNSSVNWGSGTGKIGPGDKVHLVGTLSSTLTVNGSGSSGSPITVVFESGAKMSKPYWGTGTASAIYSESQSYIVIDGGTNGIVECTANGDTLANNQSAYGIYFLGGSNNTVKNLSVQNIYVHTYGTANKVGTYTTRCVFAENVDNFTVTNCALNNAYLGVYVLANGKVLTNGVVEKNTISGCSTAVVFACGGLTGDAMNNFVMRYNDVSMGGNWYEVADLNHIDGIHTWTGAGTMSALSIYGNYFHGNPSANCTSPIYLTDNLKTCFVYSNAVIGNTTQPAEGYININLTGTADAYIFNNTIVGLGTSNRGGNGIAADPSRSGTTVHVKNNIITNVFVGLYDGSGAAKWDSDYNSISNCGTVGYVNSFLNTLLSWALATGGDSHSISSLPNLGSTYVPASGSSVIGAGTSLSSVGTSVGVNFAVDITGASRTTWDIGAVKAGTPSSWSVGANVSSSQISPPSNASVQVSIQ